MRKQTRSQKPELVQLSLICASSLTKLVIPNTQIYVLKLLVLAEARGDWLQLDTEVNSRAVCVCVCVCVCVYVSVCVMCTCFCVVFVAYNHSVLIACTCIAVPADPPMITSTEVINPRSFRVNWNPVAGSTGYQIELFLTSDLDQPIQVHTVEGIETLTFTFTGIVPYNYTTLPGISFTTQVAGVDGATIGPRSPTATTILPRKLCSRFTMMKYYTEFVH